MRNFKELEKLYLTDTPFNKLVNLFTQLLAEHGFLPSEIREGMFLAQYQYEMNNPKMIIRTQEDWQKIYEAREMMKNIFGDKNEKT